MGCSDEQQSGEGIPNTGRRHRLSFVRHVRTLSGHSGGVHALTFTPDGQKVLSADGNYGSGEGHYGEVRVWNLDDGILVSSLEGHRKQVDALAVSPDGRVALSSSKDYTARLWDLRTGTCVRVFNLQGQPSNRVGFLPDGKHALIAYSDYLMLIKLDTLRCLWKIRPWGSGVDRETAQSLEGQLNGLGISSSGHFAVCGGYSHHQVRKPSKLIVRELPSGKYMHVLRHSGESDCLALSPDDRFVLSGHRSSKLELWEVATGECAQTFKDHPGEVTAVCFTPDGAFAVSASGTPGEDLIVWDVRSGKSVERIKCPQRGYVSALEISPDGRFLAAGCRDSTLRVWELGWDYEIHDWADWDEGAKGYLEIFLTQRCPYAEDGITRIPRPDWNENDFNILLQELQRRGYGWLRPEGVRQRLIEMTENWEGPMAEVASESLEARASKSDAKPSANTRRAPSAGFQFMQEDKFAKAAEWFLGAFLSDSQNGTYISNCGTCFWLGAKKFMKLNAEVTIGSCSSERPDELFLTFLLNPHRFSGGRLATYLRENVSQEEINCLVRCFRTARDCFQRAYDLGEKGTALRWLVDLARGTGMYDQCRELVRRAIEDGGIPKEDLESVKKAVEHISRFESDLEWLSNPTGRISISGRGTIDPFVGELNMLAATANTVSLQLSDTSGVSPKEGSAKRSFGRDPKSRDPKNGMLTSILDW